MTRRFGFAIALGSIAFAVATACGSSDDSSGGGGGSAAKDGGKTDGSHDAKTDGTSTGGKAGDASAGTGGATGGTAGTPSGGTGGGAGDASGCPYTGPPLIDPNTFADCSPACSGAHCVPAALVPAAQQTLLAACSATGGGAGFCTPDFFISSLGKAVPKSCTSVAGAEGRCLSTCLPAVAAESALLPQDVCEANERCTPCYDPTSASPTTPTGACAIACDAPTKPPVVLSCPWTGPDVVDPSKLASCASGTCSNAHCLPASLVPPAQQGLLAPCAGGYCTPDPIIKTANNYVPPSCTSIAGAEGRCLSTCLPLVASLSALLPTSTCTAGDKCAPCYDPTSANPDQATGACSLGCDKPTKSPVHLTCPWTGPDIIDPSTLPNCGPAGSNCACLPAAFVPPAQQSQLATCSGGYCTPDAIIKTAGNYKPPGCAPFAGVTQSSDGRCLSDCLPAVTSQKTLEQSTCVAGSHCAPCYDPFNGTATGACSSSSCDAPTTKYVFPSCCVYNGSPQGKCIPKSQIPDAQESSLLQNSCPSSASLCVPNEQLPAPYGTKGQGCSTLLYSGTCLSSCLNLGTFGGVLPQANCPANHKCVPCSQAPAGSPGC